MHTLRQINNYNARQKAWVKANDVKRRSTMLILKTHRGYSKGWNSGWISSDMKPGLILTVARVPNIKDFIYLKMGNSSFSLAYPYTVLLPLEGKPEDYRWKRFYDQNNDIQTCLVTYSPNESDFFLQYYAGAQKIRLRKNTRRSISLKEMYGTFNKKGYYMLSRKTEDNSVVASTMRGIGLPIIDYNNFNL